MSTDLELYSFNIDGEAYGNFARGVQDFRMEIIEGPHEASWTFHEFYENIDNRGLRAWFNGRLMSQMTARYRHRDVFVGFVYSMELTYKGLVLTKSIGPSANVVIGTYTNDDGDTLYTEWFTDTEAIEMYGWKEKVVDVDTQSLEEATARAYAHLMYYVDPFMSSGSFKKADGPGVLRIDVKGRMAFGNHVHLFKGFLRYHPDHTEEEGYIYGSETTVGDEIQRILEVIDYISGWLYPMNGAIAANPTKTYMGVENTIGAFDRLLELASVPVPDDPDFEVTDETEWTMMTLHVENDGGVSYRERSQEVFYLRYPPPRFFEMPDGRKPTWDAVPGLIKVMDPQKEPILPTSWKKDANTVFAERTVMRMGASCAEFHEREEDLEDFYASVDAYEDLLEKWTDDDEDEDEEVIDE